MRIVLTCLVQIAATVMLAACSHSAFTVLPAAEERVRIARSCDELSGGDTVRCFALVRAPEARDVTPESGGIYGYNPRVLREAYGLPSETAGHGQTVAVIDAYDDPYAEADLAVYRAHFGLPPCTSSSGCFRKVNQRGDAAAYPKANSGWAQEISLDLDMVSAICPNCRILLVESDRATIRSLSAAVNTAARMGAGVISNSYGSAEWRGETAYAPAYARRGHVVVASAGDAGLGAQVPAAYAGVVAVGGTELSRDRTTHRFSETAWSGTGSGCSRFISKPAWQTDRGCAMRSAADVAAVADPFTPVAVYDSFSYRYLSGWLAFGGTSVAAPIVAAAYALAGNAAAIDAPRALWRNGGSHGLRDITTGANGSCPSLPYMCTAGPGYDGPTGWGSPSGVSAF